jgi:hypothetical protein
LQAFYDIVAKAGPPSDSAPPSDKVAEDLEVNLKFAIEDGAVPKSSKNPNPDASPENAGADSKWRVHGGDLKFRVSSVFALSSASLDTKEGPVRNVPAVPGNTPILSIPMGITESMTSHLRLKIENKDADEIPDGWLCEFVVKAVPLALWGDPKNPPEKTALDTTTKGTVDLAMAVTIKAPLPVLSVTKIEAINATEFQRHMVMEKEIESPKDQTSFLPATLSTSPQGWPAVQQTWETATKDNAETAKEMAMACMTALGWDKPAPEVVLATQKLALKPWQLNTEFPERLVTGTGGRVDGVEDGLSNMYLALPRVAV